MYPHLLTDGPPTGFWTYRDALERDFLDMDHPKQVPVEEGHGLGCLENKPVEVLLPVAHPIQAKGLKSEAQSCTTPVVARRKRHDVKRMGISIAHWTCGTNMLNLLGMRYDIFRPRMAAGHSCRSQENSFPKTRSTCVSYAHNFLLSGFSTSWHSSEFDGYVSMVCPVLLCSRVCSWCSCAFCWFSVLRRCHLEVCTKENRQPLVHQGQYAKHLRFLHVSGPWKKLIEIT